MNAVSTSERDTIVSAIRLLARHGTDAAEVIEMALLNGALSTYEVDEAALQLADIDTTA